MCIALPAKILSISGQMAVIEQNGLTRQVLLATQDAKVGNFALVYGNAVIAPLTEQEAMESTGLIKQLEEAASRQNN